MKEYTVTYRVTRTYEAVINSNMVDDISDHEQIEEMLAEEHETLKNSEVEYPEFEVENTEESE